MCQFMTFLVIPMADGNPLASGARFDDIHLE